MTGHAGDFTMQRTDVFVGGADGVHTYRIPALLATPGGTVLAFCEARKVSWRDASPTDLVLKRSADSGRSWGPLQRIVVGRGDDAIMNPCPVVDGQQVLLFCMNAHKTAPGRHRHLLLRSSDEGATWSGPEDITDAIGNDTFIPGPGVGIHMLSGRLVIPGYVAEYAADRTRLSHNSCVVFSDDGGRSWRAGGVVADPVSNEAQVVELSNGALMLNWRINRGDATHPGCRGTAISRDGGETWGAPELARALTDSRCQAGFIRGEPEDGGAARLLFSNPDARPGPGGGARTRMTVRLSEDEGRSWPFARLIHAGPSAYSCPAMLPDGQAAVLFECGAGEPRERIRFARFALTGLKASRRA